jgi:hypothetical protein
MDPTADVGAPGPVQLPVQLSPAVSHRLAQWCRETARLLDTTGVARGEVLEALIEQLVSDPDTSLAVRRRLGHQPPHP